MQMRVLIILFAINMTRLQSNDRADVEGGNEYLFIYACLLSIGKAKLRQQTRPF